MREILFRGKTIIDNEWVIGAGVYKSEGYTWIITDDVTRTESRGTGSDAIIPDTVGQYTGLTDKNGKKIFEGDIVKAETYNGKYYEEVVGTIIYIPAHMAFGIYNEQEREIDIIDTGYHNLEIIGNIHDNPELLKGE